MHMTLRSKLTVSFIIVAVLVLIAGVVGLLMVSVVGKSNDEVVKGKNPLQYATLNAALSVSQVLSMVGELSNSNRDPRPSEEDMKRLIDSFLMWMYAVKDGTVAEAFRRSEGGNTYAARGLTMAIIQGSPVVRQWAAKALVAGKSFFMYLNSFLADQEKLSSYCVTLHNTRYDVDVLLLQVEKDHLRSMKRIKDAVTTDQSFAGPLNPKDTLLGMWLSSYRTDDPALQEMLSNLTKDYGAFFSLISRIPQAQTYEDKLKILSPAMQVDIRIEGDLKKIEDYIAPLYRELRENKTKNLEALNGAAEIVPCGDMQRAIEYARGKANAGDTVLLSPACASFDQYQSFEHRGRHFEQIVGGLS